MVLGFLVGAALAVALAYALASQRKTFQYTTLLQLVAAGGMLRPTQQSPLNRGAMRLRRGGESVMMPPDRSSIRPGRAIGPGRKTQQRRQGREAKVLADGTRPPEARLLWKSRKADFVWDEFSRSASTQSSKPPR